MTQLMRLIEHYRNFGALIGEPDYTGTVRVRFEPMNLEHALWFVKVQPFVFSTAPPRDANIPFDRQKEIAEQWQPGLDDNADLDAPFQVFSCEYLNGPLDTFENPDGLCKTWCIVTMEIAPKQYGYWTLSENPDGSLIVHKSNVEGPTVTMLLNRLAREQMGTENVRHMVRLGHGKSKQMHRIRKVIHVTPKKETNHYDGNSREIDWTHRWNVRGHWRKCDGLGKDRDGNYCVHGFTWVIDHEKGPEHLPLITKTRVVTQ